MDYDSVVNFIKDLNGPNTTVEHHGKWTMACCPLAKWRHEGGTDSKPSFGITSSSGEESMFNCLTCKSKGPLDHLVDLLEEYSGEDYNYLREGLGKSEFLSNSLPTWEHKRGEKKVEKLESLPDEYKFVYDDAAGHPYLKKRGISDKAANILELLVDPYDGNVERILFPVKGMDGKLYGHTGRAVKDNVTPKVKDYWGLKKRRLLLGAHLVRPEHEFVIVVEGLFDYANLIQYGYSVVAVLHSGLTAHQRKVLLALRKPIVLMLDNDKAGMDGMENIIEELAGALPIYSVDYPPFTKKSYRKRKYGMDPGNIRKSALKHMLRNKELL